MTKKLIARDMPLLGASRLKIGEELLPIRDIQIKIEARSAVFVVAEAAIHARDVERVLGSYSYAGKWEDSLLLNTTILYRDIELSLRSINVTESFERRSLTPAEIHEEYGVYPLYRIFRGNQVEQIPTRVDQYRIIKAYGIPAHDFWDTLRSDALYTDQININTIKNSNET